MKQPGADNPAMRAKIQEFKERLAKGLSVETQIMHNGWNPDDALGAVVPPIFMTSTYVATEAEALADAFQYALDKKAIPAGQTPNWIYARVGHPNAKIVEERLLPLEKGAGKGVALVFASGMSAIACACLAHARPGQFIAFSDPVYGGSEHLFNLLPALFQVKTQGIQAQDLKKTREVLESMGQDLAILFLETPANPNLSMIDLAKLAKIAKEVNPKCVVIVDNTFLGPIFQSPFLVSPDIDIVVYSATKFLFGNSTSCGGLVVVREEKKDLANLIMGFRILLGNILHPFSSWLLMTRLDSVQYRMQAQAQNAMVVAKFLAQHPQVSRVYFPGLYEEGSVEQYVYEKQCSGSGSVMSFDLLDATREQAFCFLDLVKEVSDGVLSLAVSLGSVETLIEHPMTMTHSELKPEQMASANITPQMVRLSIGIEATDDLIAALSFALDNYKNCV